MAEHLKVFVNKEFTTADLSDNKFLLLTTDATTQAVVKTISVSDINFDPSRLRLVNDGTVLIDGFKNADGSEIIDSNSSLYYEFNPPIVAPSGTVTRRYYIYNNSTTVYTRSGSINYDHTLPLASDSPYYTDATCPSYVNDTSGMTYPAFFIMADDAHLAYYFYYDANSTTQLYYSYPSVSNGVATISGWNGYDSSSYRYRAVDFEYKRIRWFDNNAYIYTLDVNTGNTTTANVTGWSSASTYTVSATHKDVFVYSPYYTYQVFYLYDHVTEQTTSVSTGFNVNTLACTYNNTESLYYIYAGTGGQYKIYTWDGSTLQEVYSTTNGSLYIVNISGNSVASGLCAAPDGCIYANTSQARASKVKLTSNGLEFVADMYSYIPYPYSNSAFYVYPESGTPGMDLYDLKFRAKVSGVEIIGD